MTITADSAASNGRVRASSDTQPAALTPPLVVPLQAPGARSGARARAGSRAGAAGGRARSEPAPRRPDARLMVLQRRLWSVLSDHYFRRKRGQAVLAGARVRAPGDHLWGADRGGGDGRRACHRVRALRGAFAGALVGGFG